MATCFGVIDYSKVPFDKAFDDMIKDTWRCKVKESIERNPSARDFLENYLEKELSRGGSFFDIRKTYSHGNNKFFVLSDEKGLIQGFAGILKYSKTVYEINKLCVCDNAIASDFLVKSLIKYFENIDDNSMFELQTVVEKKNTKLLNAMIKNGFVEFHESKIGVNVYLKYKTSY